MKNYFNVNVENYWCNKVLNCFRILRECRLNVMKTNFMEIGNFWDFRRKLFANRYEEN